MIETEAGFVVEWRIENFSHWCAEVHGECIETPKFSVWYCHNMQLYPKGMSGTEEHLVVHFCDNKATCSGDLSFYSSNGVVLCKQPLNATKGTAVLELPPGPKFEDVLSRIRGESDEDFITVRCRIRDTRYYKQLMRTTINVSKTSLKISPSWIEKLKPNETKLLFYIELVPNDLYRVLKLETCLKNSAVNFMIRPQENGTPFAVAMCVSLTRSDGTIENRGKKEHVFRDESPWTFPDSLEKKELVGKAISLFLCLKTRHLIQSPSILNYDSCSISTEPNYTLTEKEPSTNPVTSNKDSVTVVTKDSESHTSVTSDMPDDSVLSKDLMCLYQDQDFSVIILKCHTVSFPVHRNILTARSPVFKTMLSCDMKEASSNEVDIGDLDPSTLGLFLTYLYTGAVEDLQCDVALKLYYAADKYQVPSLKKECSKFLCSNVSLSNVCDILSLADRHQDDQIMSVAHDFILDNYNAVLKSKEWDTLKKNEPILAANTLTHFAVEDRVRKHNPQ